MKKVFLPVLFLLIAITPVFASIKYTKSFPIGASVGEFHTVEATGTTSSSQYLDLTSDEVRDVNIGGLVGHWSIYSNYNPLSVKIEAADLTNGMDSNIPYLLKFSYEYAIYENGEFKEDDAGVFYVKSATCNDVDGVQVEADNIFTFVAAYQPQGISSAIQQIRLIVPESINLEDLAPDAYSATVKITITGGEQ